VTSSVISALQDSQRSPMTNFFSPASVAVIGATDRDGSVGRTVVANLLAAYEGKIYGINPTRSEILGVPCYPSIEKVPEKTDLAIVVTPAATVPGIIGECVRAGTKAAIVISAGFKEMGAAGVALERRIQEELRRGSMRLIGPNCLGVMNPLLGLNATFAKSMTLSGNVALLSQSGALLTAVLDWSLSEQVGFSTVVSTGSMLDVSWGDLITFFGDDPHTRSILVYMESVGDVRAFMSAAREVALSKPIIVIKAGRSEAASRAAASHTGALTGSDEVFDAACRRCGVLRVQDIADVFHMAEVLGRQPRPHGPRLMILTNAGGPGVLATDALIASGGELAALSEGSLKRLDSFLPPHWSHNNPIDVLGDADAERYARAIEIAIEDPLSDGLLAVLAPQGMTDPAGMAKGLSAYARGHNKPVLASWMGGKGVAEGIQILNASGIPTFSYPDTAARIFESMWRYTYNLRTLYETPYVADDPVAVSARGRETRKIIQRVLTAGRTLLNEMESKEILRLYGIPTVPTWPAKTVAEAVARAEQLGHPVVLKLYSETITHKSDVGGVKLNLNSAAEVRKAYHAIESAAIAQAGRASFMGVTVQPMIRQEGYELIIGSSVDPQFGPVLLFGSGGQLVEVYRDRALGLPPLNTTLAHRLMEQTRIYRALKGVRGRGAVDLPALQSLLVRFSQLVVEQPRISEIDINPLLASREQLLALDARMVLHGPQLEDDELPRTAIRPYPSQYISRWKMKDTGEVLIRPIRPEDEPLMVRFHGTLSESTVYLRYFHMEKVDSRIAHERLIRKCFIDYDREMALVAIRKNPQSGGDELIGVGRLTRQHAAGEAELAVIVTDRYQGRGLGTELVRQLIEIARKEKLQHVLAHMLADNHAMLSLARRFHFDVRRDEDDAVYRTAVLELEP